MFAEETAQSGSSDFDAWLYHQARGSGVQPAVAVQAKQTTVEIVEWCNKKVVTYDPRRVPAFLPFHLFPKQEEYLRWLDHCLRNEERGLVEKSRDSGLTWLCCVFAVHAWLYRGPVSIGFGSRKLSLVDTLGDPDSILEKCRIILRNLPKEDLPAGFDIDKHAGRCRIVNPATGATITGEGGDQIGRGGRKTIYFVDEAAFIERAHLADAALSQTTNCQIDVSTPNGSGNGFYRKRHSGKMKVFRFHWTDDPRKGQGWYDKQVAMLDPVTVAQEIDIDYTASVEGICIPAAWVRAAINIELPSDGRKIGGYDVADEGANKSVLVGRQGPVVFDVQYWQRMTTTRSAHKSADIAEELGLDVLYYDSVGVGAGVKGAYDAMERELNFTPFPVNVGVAPTNTYWDDGQTSVQKFINLRAEAWWMMRRRFEKTYENLVEKIEKPHPEDELISIPNDNDLIVQLSQPLAFKTETGKIKIESKDAMRKRGISSPDYADACALAFLPNLIPELLWA